ncbi:MAG: MiaB/RimO family radical SAM methylthiotransferase, partial [Nitrospinota bacterium]|nr:MiaB/RimO family radical SAM methylthiotransferase [Nitrospinota bacterium]
PAAVARVEGVSLVLGNAEKFSMAQALTMLDARQAGAAPLVLADHGPMPASLPVRPISGMAGRTNAYLNVQSGCDETCSFCVVRLARGKSRSAGAQELVEQVKRLRDAGVKEVVLSGINIGQYQDGPVDLAELMELILSRTDLPRARLSSINPNNITGRLIDLMAAEPRFCPHLHIPLQHGSDRILKLMRRPYTVEMYESLLNELASRVEGIGLGADVMTGFPGEAEEDHLATRALIQRLPLMMLHVFSYSPRQGTEAFSLPGQVAAGVARERAAELKSISEQKRRRFMEQYVGRKLQVLVENSRTPGGALKGFTQNYIPVQLQGPDSLLNTMAEVIGHKASGGKLDCRLAQA